MEKTEFWETAYSRNAPLLRGVLRRYVPDRETVQDLLHEAFITAIYKEKSFSGKGNFDGWLYRITVNTALMYLRKQKAGITFTDLMTVEHDEEQDEQENMEEARKVIEEAGFTNEELLQAIDRLPDHHRMVFNLYVMDGYTHKQIAGELNISAGTSKSHLARARRKIQHYLYEDALRKKKERRALLIPLLPAGEDFIDRLCRSGLSGYSIPGTDSAGFIAGVVGQQAAVSVAGVSSGIGAWGVIGACCGTAAVTALVCWSILGDPASGEMKKVLPADRQDTVLHAPFLSPEKTVSDNLPDGEQAFGNNSPETTGLPEADPPAPNPVVVKKKIVERKTVVLRDTIYIND
ncbi:MAG: sigma-70 family RNA polymerase sigma factor [Culturomica sp.]|jgi:RNA polymerase sigma factor (sigma-70 family)|nr:sigma-70 family RNA polymerase sigma factor [Culturomica sp.]